MNLNLLKIFVKVAQLGSYTKASKLLNMPKSRISRAISRLEEDQQVELIRRSTRSLALTESGLRLYQDTRGLLDELESKIESVASGPGGIKGTLSLSAPVDMGQNILPKLIGEFSQRYPQIKFRIHLSDSYIDLNAFDIDVAIRAGNLKDSALKQKKLGQAQLILVASFDYLQRWGVPKNLKELKNHQLISFFNENQVDPLGDICHQYQITPLYRVNSFPLIKRLVRESKGIGILPDTLCFKELREGKLVRVLPQWCEKKSTIQAVYLASKNLSPKIRAFLDFLAEKENIFV